MIDLMIIAGGPEEANELGKQILGYPGLWITHNSEIREILNTLKSKGELELWKHYLGKK